MPGADRFTRGDHKRLAQQESDHQKESKWLHDMVLVVNRFKGSSCCLTRCARKSAASLRSVGALLSNMLIRPSAAPICQSASATSISLINAGSRVGSTPAQYRSGAA